MYEGDWQMAKEHFEHHLQTKEIKAWALDWEPRTKLVTCILFIFGVVGLQSPLLVCLVFLMSVTGSRLSGLSWSYIAKKLLLISPFLVLLSLPLLFGNGWSPSEARYTLVSLIILKAATSLTIMLLLFKTQTETQLLSALAQLKLPAPLLSILFLSYRFLFLFAQYYQKIWLALQARLMPKHLNIQACRSYGRVAGGLLLKAFDMSDKVHQAMAARGLNSFQVVAAKQTPTPTDLFKAVVLLIFIFCLLAYERLI